MGMTPNEAELIDVESHYPTDRIPMEMKEKSVAENLLDKMSETQWAFLSSTVFYNTKKEISISMFQLGWFVCIPTTEYQWVVLDAQGSWGISKIYFVSGHC